MDSIDVAQRRQQEEIEHALAGRRAPAAGLTVCEDAACGEPISPVRQAMGARLCLDCALAQEKEARKWAPRGQG